MFSEPTISANSISKVFHLYQRPRDRFIQLFLPNRRKLYQEFWAVKDVSLHLGKGETIGIIGRNGSGKSTLLQMICGTLSPTSGTIEINGRVAALLELGSGFNPEFTGRENIYLNAALYGLSRDLTDERFERIAAFADIGDFIEHPVKTYSSGMLVRLAFAVIANVDADVLVVDEALAVGDAVFTQKCMRFIRDFKARGTLVFVSHDMGSVINLCDRAIWLDKGQIVSSGDAKYVTQQYLKDTLQLEYGAEIRLAENAPSLGGDEAISGADSEPTALSSPSVDGSGAAIRNNLRSSNGWKSGFAEIINVHIEDSKDKTKLIFSGGETVILTVRALINRPMDSIIIGFMCRDKLGQDLFGQNTHTANKRIRISAQEGDTIDAQFTFKLPLLPNGQYSFMASIAEGELEEHIQHHWIHDALIMNISSSTVRWGLVGIEFENVTAARNNAWPSTPGCVDAHSSNR